MAIVFGSPEANEILLRDGGPRFDLRDADPLVPIHTQDPPDEEPEPICDECGYCMEWEDCWNCGGKGGRDGEDLMEEDPLWYDEDDWEDCDICEGKGGYWLCPNAEQHDKEQQK